MSRGALLMVFLGSTCLPPPEQWGVVAPEQHLVALDYSKAGYRQLSLEYASGKGCSDAAWEFDRWVFQNVDCVADDDCVVLSGVEVFEVNRVAVNRRLDAAAVKAWVERLQQACGLYENTTGEDKRAYCLGRTCALRAPSRSRLSHRTFDP